MLGEFETGGLGRMRGRDVEREKRGGAGNLNFRLGDESEGFEGFEELSVCVLST